MVSHGMFRRKTTTFKHFPWSYSPRSTLLFADDTTILFKGADCSKLLTSFNFCKPYIETWLLANKLHINLEKTCFFLYGKNLTPLQIDLFNINIEQCSSSSLLELPLIQSSTGKIILQNYCPNFFL